jgi:hypothetical protein
MSKPQIIQPRNTLRAKIGGQMPAIDAAALARAEAEFQAWMEEEVAKMDVALAAGQEAGFDDASLEALYGAAHDAKGLGTTYEYPIITRIAASLCRLLETPEARARARGSISLVDAHVNAAKAAVRAKIKNVEHPTGKALVAELETRAMDIVKAAQSAPD